MPQQKAVFNEWSVHDDSTSRVHVAAHQASRCKVQRERPLESETAQDMNTGGRVRVRVRVRACVRVPWRLAISALARGCGLRVRPAPPDLRGPRRAWSAVR